MTNENSRLTKFITICWLISLPCTFIFDNGWLFLIGLTIALEAVRTPYDPRLDKEHE